MLAATYQVPQSRAARISSPAASKSTDTPAHPRDLSCAAKNPSPQETKHNGSRWPALSQTPQPVQTARSSSAPQKTPPPRSTLPGSSARRPSEPPPPATQTAAQRD